MSERPDPHASATIVGKQGQSAEHAADAGHDPDAQDGDGHGGDAHASDAHGGDAHGGEALGPFDLPKWGAAALGMILGLIVVFAFVQATT